MQAYNLSKDHKPDLEIEKERIYKAGGYIQCGRVNGTLNLSRAIGTLCEFNLIYEQVCFLYLVDLLYSNCSRRHGVEKG